MIFRKKKPPRDELQFDVLREYLREKMVAVITTEENNTFADGYFNGLAISIHTIDRMKRGEPL